ncbi:MAG: zinc ribbon domain-containing protein [Deltaproteobacteria bacterium]|nr:zinc ribbon domain-containing protein [Deltaproteobacteria bacterium]
MKCPQCGEENPDGTMICEHCDAILDDSFLEDEEDLDEDYASAEDTPGGRDTQQFAAADEEPWDEEEEDEEDVRAAAPPSAPSSGQRSFSREQMRKKAQQREIPEPDEEDEEEFAEIRRQREEVRKRRTAALAGRPKPMRIDEEKEKGKGQGLAIEASQVGKDVEGMLSKLKAFFLGLPKQDKLSLIGAGVMFLSSLFPWVEIEQQGSRIGLEMGGLFLILLAAALVALVYLRSSPDWKERAHYVLFGQLGVAGIALVFGLAKLFTSSSFTSISPADGVLRTHAGHLQFGIILAFLACGLAAGGSFWIFKQDFLDKRK